MGAAADAHRLPRLDLALTEAEQLLHRPRIRPRVIDVPGHTIGHIAFHFPQSRLAFTADSLMAGGCGRLFEGTARQMHASLAETRRPAPRHPDLLGPRIHRLEPALCRDP